MKKKLSLIVACLLIFGGGFLLGFLVRPDGFIDMLFTRIAGAETDQQDTGDDKADEEQPNHVEVSATAKQNLGLRTKRIGLSDYTVSLRVPGVIIEKPGFSDWQVSTTVHGVVTKVYAARGQAVRPGDPLVDVQLTGENLVAAQSDLLATLQRIEVTNAELKRIAGLAEQGGVAGKLQLQLEYDGKRLAAQRDVKKQELAVRGLSAAQISQIITRRKLIRELTLSVPHFRGTQISMPVSNATARTENTEESVFTVEALEVFPGKSILPGDDLCHLANHSVLYIEGQAFEKELDTIAAMNQRGRTASIEFGTQGAGFVRRGFPIVYVDNSVDEESQVFRFYLSLKNDVLQETADQAGNRYRSWRFKPGQRVHVVVPIQELTDQLILPNEAVVQEGANAFVFRRLKMTKHVHVAGQPHVHDHGEEYERVPIHILHQDAKQCVVSRTGELKVRDRIAINNAYQLLLAMKSGSGGGHAHPHPHPH